MFLPNLKKVFYHLICFCFLASLTLISVVNAQEPPPGKGYILLEPSVLVGVEISDNSPTNLSTYLKGAYQTFFVIVFSSAIILIVWAGFEYMVTDVVTTKGNAKKRIQDALWGLAIAGLSYLVLYIINPDLVKFNLNL